MSNILDEVVEKYSLSKEYIEKQKKLRSIYDTLLPVERASFKIDERISKIDNKLIDKFPIFDLSAVLMILNKNKLPRFALFDIKSSTINIRIDPFNGNRYPEYYPQEVNNFYYASYRNGRASKTFKATFVGIIPTEIRNKILKNEDKFERICLLQEVSTWEVEEKPLPLNRDPLVIGFKNGITYLMDKFDTTTMEEYVSKEFSL